ATLEDARQTLGDRRVAVCRELTKVHEEVFRASLSQAIEHFAQPRGEFTLVIEGGKPERAGVDAETEQELRRLRRGGYTALEAVGKLSQVTGIGRKKLYQRWLELAKEK
ncbi:MAG: 16S rRNA (cytidine(1402)-2'-O)-methyltransferase, partial [Chloroflexota bacterium]